MHYQPKLYLFRVGNVQRWDAARVNTFRGYSIVFNNFVRPSLCNTTLNFLKTP